MKTRGRFADIFVPHSLRFQLLSRSLFILSILLLLIGVFQYIFMQQFLYNNKVDSITTQLKSLPPNIWMRGKEGPGRGNNSRNDNNAERDGATIPPRRDLTGGDGSGNDGGPRFIDLSLAWIDENGNFTLVSTPDGMVTPQLSNAEYQDLLKSGDKRNFSRITDSNGNEQLVVFHVFGFPDRSQGILQGSVSTKQIKDVLIRQLITFLSLSMLALVAGLLAFLPVLRRTLIPLSNMIETVKRIDAGNLEERLPAHQGQMEIDRLSASFNGMLERLEISFEAEKEAKEQMRRFLADASHELRTPLTSIHGFLEVLLRGAYNQPEQLLKALKSMHGESERINKLVNDLFLLVRLDRTPTSQLADGQLDEVIRDMEPQLRLLAGDRAVTLDVAPGTRYKFDSDKIKQVVLNLFHNAVQHTNAATGQIKIKLSQTADAVELAVQDNGPGIPADHLPHVFDRFYRIDSSRARKNGGAGLGLSITKSIVDLHDGTIHVESKEGEGCTFRIRLPLH